MIMIDEIDNRHLITTCLLNNGGHYSQYYKYVHIHVRMYLLHAYEYI